MYESELRTLIQAELLALDREREPVDAVLARIMDAVAEYGSDQRYEGANEADRDRD